jgi:hemerythrin
MASPYMQRQTHTINRQTLMLPSRTKGATSESRLHMDTVHKETFTVAAETQKRRNNRAVVAQTIFAILKFYLIHNKDEETLL